MTGGDADLRARTVSSLFWQFLGVGGQRVVQMVSLSLVARLLPKEDIGLFVVVLMGIGVIEALTQFVGEQTTISSQQKTDQNYLDTVFTVRLLRGLVISSILVGLAWPLAAFFADPEAEAHYWLPGLFLILAPNGVLDALQSPARAVQMKGLDFRRIVLGEFVAAVLGVGLTLTLAFLWHDIWAMLVGYLGTTAIKSTISYVYAPHRSRFCLDRAVLKELLHYNIGAAGAPFLILMILTAPAFVLGKVLLDKGALAIFDFAGRLAKLPEDIFLRVLGPVAIPAYAQLRGDAQRLKRGWLRAVHTFLLVGAPMTVTMAWCGDALPGLVFGGDYGSIPGLFALQSLHGGLAGLTAVVGPLFWAMSKPHLDRRAQFFRCVAMYGLGIPAALWGGVMGFAAATCVAIGIGLLLSVWFALRLLQVPLRDFLSATRDGLGIGLLLLGALVTIDMLLAPNGIWRIVAAAVTGGPLLALLCLRLLRNRNHNRGAPIADLPTDPTGSAIANDPMP